jgi:aquaporin Z
MSPSFRIAVLEGIGTAVLVMVGAGTAVLASESVGVIGVALAFGLSLTVMIYTIGPITGCHINPAVTLGLLLLGRTSVREAPYYVVGQIVGGLSGALVVFVLANGADGFDARGSGFAANGYGAHSPGGYGLGAAALSEIVLTALLVFVVAATLQKGYAPGVGGLVVGFTLAVIILLSSQVANTSVNPARSIATAVFQNGWAMEQLWAFILYPLVGGALGAAAARMIYFREQPHRQPEEPVDRGRETVASPPATNRNHAPTTAKHSARGRRRATDPEAAEPTAELAEFSGDPVM